MSNPAPSSPMTDAPAEAQRPTPSLRNLIWSDYGDPQVTAWVTALQLQMVDRAVFTTSIMTIVALPPLLWSFRGADHGPILLIGGMALLLVSALRLMDIVARRGKRLGSEAQRRALHRTIALSTGTGLAWAILITGIGHGSTPDELTFVICLHIALVSAGSASLASIPAASLFFVALLGADALVNIAIGVWPLMPVAQLLLLMFLAMMIRAALGQARVLAERGISEIGRIQTERARIEERAVAATREGRLQAQAEAEAARARLQHEEKARQHRQEEMVALARRFEETVLAGSSRVLDAAGKLRDRSDSLHALGTDIGERTGAVNVAATAAREAAQRVALTTSGVHDMALSISAQVSAQAEASVRARQASEESDSSVRSLAVQVDGIERITALISDIAARTNMLALNAAIEASRAGDAGKGFGVVAVEVKALAQQTRAATHDIEGQLNAMQTHVARAAGSIADTVQQLGSLTRAAAAIEIAVKDQQSAAKQIHVFADEASIGTALLDERYGSIAHATRQAGTLSEEVRSTVAIVMGQTAELRDESSAFIARLRAA